MVDMCQAYNPPMNPPKGLDLDREKGLTVEWAEGGTSFYPVAHLRKLSPSADQRELRKELDSNPLAVLPTTKNDGPLTAVHMELVGNYAVSIHFSDGHHAGIYTWEYLRQIEPAN
jgi:DUF971 family protein